MSSRSGAGDLTRAVEATVTAMSLEQRVGQVCMVGFDGTRLDETVRTLVSDLHVGGVTLFGRNVVNAHQVAQLTAELQTLADHVPLFISIDQEGGLVVRVTSGATVWPGNMALGATRDGALAMRVAEATAHELRAMGITMQLGPVADVNTNPLNPVIGTRAFGSTPQLVAQMTEVTVAGLQARGVSAVAKHFPGHGATATDSHRELPTVERTRAALDVVDLSPFVAAIAAGADGIMSAHVSVPALDRRRLPATLSYAVLTDLLRTELAYSGLIVTDALDMAAITRDRSVAEAAVVAFAAGADVLCVAGIDANDRARMAEVPRALLAAVRSGRISEVRLEASVRRIVATKVRRGRVRGAIRCPAGGGAGCEGTGDAMRGQVHGALALEVARRAVTLLRDRDGLLPLRADQRIAVVENEDPGSSAVRDDRRPGSLSDALRRFAPHVTSGPLDAVGLADIVVLGTYDLALDAAQRGLALNLVASGRPVVGVALRGAYDAQVAPGVGTYLAVYGNRPVHLQAAAETLFGRLTPTGRVP